VCVCVCDCVHVCVCAGCMWCVCLQIIFAQVGFILAVATYLVAQGDLGDRMYDGVEYFSGVATWTASLRKNDFRCATFEILDDSVLGDLLSPEGMINAMKLVFEVFPSETQLTSKLHFPSWCSKHNCWCSG
jgi:hypothetical protein